MHEVCAVAGKRRRPREGGKVWFFFFFLGVCASTQLKKEKPFFRPRPTLFLPSPSLPLPPFLLGVFFLPPPFIRETRVSEIPAALRVSSRVVSPARLPPPPPKPPAWRPFLPRSHALAPSLRNGAQSTPPFCRVPPFLHPAHPPPPSWGLCAHSSALPPDEKRLSVIISPRSPQKLPPLTFPLPPLVPTTTISP